MTDTAYWIWLQLLFGIATRRAELMMDYFDHPRAIAEGITAGDRTLGMLTPEELAASPAALHRAAEIERRTRSKGCDIVTPDHPDYPPLLRGLYDRPAALYVKGELGCLRDALAVAVVGTRKCTPYGKKASELLAGGLARAGAVVVSGLATGIDTECHRAALAAGGKTVGVLGCGIDVDYPKQSRALKTAMSGAGAVVTEFPLGTQPLPANFPQRNRILSGMAQATLVIEADPRSGSLITARLAREQGRDVFAVPGSIFQEGGQGTHQLIKEGARLAETPEDILSCYPNRHRAALSNPIRVPEAEPAKSPARKHPAPPTANKPERKPALPADVDEDVRQVYGAFAGETLTVDDLVQRTGLGAAETLAALTELEIYGAVTCYPGRRFGPA